MKTYEKMSKKLKLPRSERSAVSVAEFQKKYKIPSYYTATAWIERKAKDMGARLRSATVRKGTRGPPATVFWVEKGKGTKVQPAPKRKYTRRLVPVEQVAEVAPAIEPVPGSINAEPVSQEVEAQVRTAVIEPIDGPSFLKRYMSLTAEEREGLNPPPPDVAPIGQEAEAAPTPDAEAVAP